MSREASPYTQAIRELVTKHPNLTHKAARPMLKAMGQPIVAEPPDKSDEFGQIEKAYDIGSPVKPNLEHVRAAAEALKFDDKTCNRVVHEAQMRGAWAFEANTFNVIKHGWQKTKDSGKPSKSSKPKSSKNVKAKTAKKVKKPAVVVASDTSDDVLSVVEGMGGIQAVEAKVAALKAEVAKLEQVAADFTALSARIAKAAA